MSSLVDLQAMKRAGRKIAGLVAWDTPTARIAEECGIDLVSIGDSVGVNLWGREREGDVSVDELALLCGAVRRGVSRAVVSCDLPKATLENARRLLAAGADVVKVESNAAELCDAGIPVFAQIEGGDDVVEHAQALERAGAALIDFRHSGPDEGARVAAALSIPVLGGLGGGPWLDGRVRLVTRLVDTGDAVRDAVAGYVDDVRGARAVQGD